MGMNTLFVAAILVVLGVVIRWILVYLRPGIVNELAASPAKASAPLPPLPPTAETVVGALPEVNVQPWLEGARIPESPSIDFGLLGLDEDREADDIAIWRTVRRALAMRRDMKARTEKS